MRRYSAADEERIRMHGRVRAWARAGLLDAQQAARLEARLRTTLRRTNPFLRAALAFFTALVAAASIALAFVSFGIHDRGETAVTLAVAALVCIAAAEYLAGAFRLYRYGVEEMLAIAAVVCASVSASVLAHAQGPDRPGVAALLIGSAGGFAVYRRFGFVYAAIIAMILASFVPGELALSNTMRRVAGAAIFAACFAAARVARRRHGDDYPGDDDAWMQAAAYGGLYVALNVHVSDIFGRIEIATAGRAFYWATYAATWLLPIAGLVVSIREKDRLLLTASGAAALVTLVTNKPYLGRTSESWDPILFGLLLVAIATSVRRWLESGPGRQRGGFTAEKVLERDEDWLRTIATASTAWPPHDVHAARPAEPPPSQFEGGRSGGGGGGASY